MIPRITAEISDVNAYAYGRMVKALDSVNRTVPRFMPDGSVSTSYAELTTMVYRQYWRDVEMTRIMYDSTDPENVPQGADIVAYYPHAAGSDMSKHADSLQIRVDVTGNHADDCHVLDLERGPADLGNADEWVRMWRDQHPDGMEAVNGFVRKPVVCCDAARLDALRAVCTGLDYDTWAVSLNGETLPIDGCFARQYRGDGPNGEDYGMSLVYDDTWGREPTGVQSSTAPEHPVDGTLYGTVTFHQNGVLKTQNVTYVPSNRSWQ